jgi:hypothetical protein
MSGSTAISRQRKGGHAKGTAKRSIAPSYPNYSRCGCRSAQSACSRLVTLSLRVSFEEDAFLESARTLSTAARGVTIVSATSAVVFDSTSSRHACVVPTLKVLPLELGPNPNSTVDHENVRPVTVHQHRRFRVFAIDMRSSRASQEQQRRRLPGALPSHARRVL